MWESLDGYPLDRRIRMRQGEDNLWYFPAWVERVTERSTGLSRSSISGSSAAGFPEYGLAGGLHNRQGGIRFQERLLEAPAIVERADHV